MIMAPGFLESSAGSGKVPGGKGGGGGGEEQIKTAHSNFPWLLR